LLGSTHLRIPARLRAVVFDMDGVIVDSHPAHRFAWKEFLGKLGKDVPDSELDFVMDGRKREDILIHFLGPLSDAQLEEYGQLKNDLFWRAASEVVPIPGIFKFIECLNRAGIPMGLATSASTNRARSTLKRMGLMGYFATLVTGDEVRLGKPDPEIYQLACQRIHCPPSAAVAFEDAASGVRAAKNAGLRCVGIASNGSGHKLTTAGADYVVPNFLNLTVEIFHSLIGMNPQRSYSRENERK
jgi:beta-phosphoglucomutase